MTKSVVQVRTSKDILDLKPIQPTQFWTFDNALSLLKSSQDPYILDALDEFLLMNNKFLKSSSPFSDDGNSTLKSGLKDLSIRNILYTDITTNNIGDAKKIQSFLKLDITEIIRIVCQTCKKIPERKVYDLEKLKSKLPDDREKYIEQERLLLYTSKILRERRTILKIAVELLNNKTNTYASSTVQNLGKEIFLSSDYMPSIIQSLETTTNSLIDETYMSGITQELDDLICTETVLYIIDLTKIMVELLLQNPNINKETTNKWFKFMATNNFVLALGPLVKYQESFNLLQGLSTIVSILFLDLDNNFDSDANDSNTTSILTDVKIFKSINDYITSPQNMNSVISYAWSIILLRKYYFLQEYSTMSSSVTFLNELSLETIDAILNQLNLKCSNLGVFQDLYKLNELLRFDNIYSAILCTLIIAAMPLITLTPEVSTTIESILKNAPNSVIERFFDNESTINQIVLSRAKFPILLTPYLKIASINGNFAFHEFNDLKSYISIFNKDEFKKIYEIDSDNTELVKLKESVLIYPPFEENKKLSLILDIGTKAKILPSANQDDVLVTFLYKYNGWAFLGRVLQNVSKLFNNADKDKIDFTVQILNLLTKVVQDNSVDEAKSVLEAMSAYTDDSDILEVILRLLEQGLHSRDVNVLQAVINLLTQLVPFLSYRIWPYLSKSALLPNNGKEGFASTIYGAIEMVNGDFKFTISLVNFVHSLVQSSLTLNEDYPEKSKSIILTKLINHLILVFESFVHCRFNESYQKMEVGVLVLDVFSNILAIVYGADDESKPAEKVTKVFADASISILDSFLISGTDYSRSSFPILNMIDSLSSNLNLYEISDISGFWFENWIRCSLAFSQLVISIRSSLNYPPSTFERNLFKKLPALVSTYSQYETLRKDVLDLMSALTNGRWNDEPIPSLLSHLGRDQAQVLLHSLASDLDNSFDDYKLKISLYDFICAVMVGNQQGLSVLFISGKDMFGDFTKDKENKEPEPKRVSILAILKKNVRDIKYYPNAVSVHLLDAIALAFNSWTTARENDDDTEFIKELIARVQLPILDQPKSTEEYVSRCYEQKLVSKIAEILSLFLFTTRNESSKKSILDLISSDNFVEILKIKFAVSDYHPSLHSSLYSSFEGVFPKLKLSQFRTTLSKRNRFGVAAVYNLALMEGLLKNNDSWPRLKEEIIASSINFQYLNSQISVAKSFGALLTAYCRRFDGTFSPKLLEFVEHLLKLNVSEGIPAEIFSLVYQERIELAFYITYSVYNRSDVEKDPKQVFEIIKVGLDLLSSGRLNFLTSLAESSGSYRPLLRTLCCCLNMIKNDTTILIEYFSVFRDLFELIITKGTRTLSIEIQNDVYLSRSNRKHVSTKMNDRIDDLMLILSILKIFVGIKSYPKLNHEMANLVNDNGTITSLLNLFSLSHSVEVNDEHIFAQLSLMFVQELMTIEIIAEKFVSSGLFVALVESPISNPIKIGGISVSSDASYHRIWINGILPIIIISLHKLGPAVVPEACLALQMFGKQIESCIDSWSRDSSSIQITSATVAETSQLLLLYKLLKSLNVDHYYKKIRHVNEGDDADMQMLPGLDTATRREEFVDCINNLLKHPKFLSSRVAPSTADELRIIEKGDASYTKFFKTLMDEIRDFKEYF